MDVFEEAVLSYATAPRTRFASPQFEIPWSGLDGGSCPDFVVLDFADITVYVIEVSAAARVGHLMEKLSSRQTRWLAPLRRHFSEAIPALNAWDYHVTAFVRDELVSASRTKAAEWPDVSIISLDKVVLPWHWAWDGQRAINPLR